MPNRDPEYRAAARRRTAEHVGLLGPRPWEEVLLRLLVVGAAPVALLTIDAAADAAGFRGPVDGRAEQCSVFWVVGVGLWSSFRLRVGDLRLFAAASAAGGLAVVAVDSYLRHDQGGWLSLPPPMGMFGMIGVLVVASLVALTRRVVLARAAQLGSDE